MKPFLSFKLGILCLQLSYYFLSITMAASKKAKLDQDLTPSLQTLGKTVPGRRSTRRTYVSTTKATSLIDSRYWQWESMRTGVEYDSTGREVDYRSPTMESTWSWLLPELQSMILDMAYRNDH